MAYKIPSCADSCPRTRAVRYRRISLGAVGHFPAHRCRSPRDMDCQLVRAYLGDAPLRDSRYVNKQLVGRADQFRPGTACTGMKSTSTGTPFACSRNSDLFPTFVAPRYPPVRRTWKLNSGQFPVTVRTSLSGRNLSRFRRKQAEDDHTGGGADENFSVGDHGCDVFIVGKIIASTRLIAVVQLISQIAGVVSMEHACLTAASLHRPNDSIGSAV